MTQKSSVLQLFIVVLIVTAVLGILWWGKAVIHTSQTAAPGQVNEAQKNSQEGGVIVGVLRTVGNSGEEIGMANNLHGLNARFQVIRQGQLPSTADQYVWGHFSSPEVEAAYEALDTSKSGLCVVVNYTQIATPPPAAEYSQGIPILTVSGFQLLSDYSCYDANPDLFPTQSVLLDQPMITLSATITSAPRPAYDIGYDYEISVPWSEAKKLGYNDASGLEHPGDMPTAVYLRSLSLDIEKKIESAKRSGLPVTLTGQFVGGYAESTVLQVVEVTTKN